MPNKRVQDIINRIAVSAVAARRWQAKAARTIVEGRFDYAEEAIGIGNGSLMLALRDNRGAAIASMQVAAGEWVWLARDARE